MKEKVFEWVKTHWRKILIGLVITFFVLFILLILIIGVPILIHTIFDIPAPRDWLEAEWDREDVLGYYGDVLGFLGTVVLSSLALWQNHVIKVEADKKEKLLEKMEYDKNMPILHFKHCLSSGRYGNLTLTIFNASDNAAHKLKIYDFIVKDATGLEICRSKGVKLKKDYIFGRTENEVEFRNESLYGEDLQLEFILEYVDKFKKQHRCKVLHFIKNTNSISNVYEIIELV